MNDPAAWRLFRRMQMSVLAVGLLVYAAAALDAWQALSWAPAAKLQLTVIFPGAYMALALAGALGLPMIRRTMRRHLLVSYRAGFGQSVISVATGLGLLVAVAGVIVWQTHGAAHGGRSPAGAFAGYGAGLGLLAAQAWLVSRLSDPGDGA